MKKDDKQMARDLIKKMTLTEKVGNSRRNYSALNLIFTTVSTRVSPARRLLPTNG